MVEEILPVPGFSILTIMNTRSISKKVGSLSLLADLYYEQKTGVITIRGDRRTIRVHLKKGLLTHAEGLDVDTLFLRKIAREKGLHLII